MKLNSRGFVLLETVIVSVFIISIFTFVYISVVPLLGKYENLAHDYNIDITYKLYHVRDALYKDSNFEEMVSNSYRILTPSDFSNANYYQKLSTMLFKDDNYQIVYIRQLEKRVSSALQDLEINGGFKDYIEKIAKTKADETHQNFIFLEDNGNYAHLGLAVNLNDTTNYQEPGENDLNNHIDTSYPSVPLLMDGMIPVYYDYSEGMWRKADASNRSANHTWYDYRKYMWANVVLVREDKRSDYLESSIGHEILMSDILGFYVWIPRYEYFIEGSYGKNGENATLPGEISINFVDTNVAKIRTNSGNTWRTASSFTFGSEELSGFWFAKFEMSNSELLGYMPNNKAVPLVLPNMHSWTGQTIAESYNKIVSLMNGSNAEHIYGLLSSSYASDTHVMKNDEWGAVAYLAQSKYGKYGNDTFLGENKQVYLNNRQDSATDASITTGSSAGHPPNESIKPVTKTCATDSVNTTIGCYQYFVEGLGTGASTTGTIYGVYDMSGGTLEIIMGSAGDSTSLCTSKAYIGTTTPFTGFRGPYSMNNTCNTSASSIAFPTNSKYFQIYALNFKYGCDTDGVFDDNDICYSHAMSETEGWYDNVYERVSKERPWYTRGGRIAMSSGIFAIISFNGTDDFTTRPIIAVY